MQPQSASSENGAIESMYGRIAHSFKRKSIEKTNNHSIVKSFRYTQYVLVRGFFVEKILVALKPSE